MSRTTSDGFHLMGCQHAAAPLSEPIKNLAIFAAFDIPRAIAAESTTIWIEFSHISFATAGVGVH
jgi:hypothetical protein